MGQSCAGNAPQPNNPPGAVTEPDWQNGAKMVFTQIAVLADLLFRQCNTP
jgi:hypothetical protein